MAARSVSARARHTAVRPTNAERPSITLHRYLSVVARGGTCADELTVVLIVFEEGIDGLVETLEPLLAIEGPRVHEHVHLRVHAQNGAAVALSCTCMHVVES